MAEFTGSRKGVPVPKGQSGNPGGKSRFYHECRNLAREASPEMMAGLIDLAKNSVDERVRSVCLVAVLDRAGVKPTDYDPTIEEATERPKFNPSLYSPEELNLIERVLRLMVDRGRVGGRAGDWQTGRSKPPVRITPAGSGSSPQRLLEEGGLPAELADCDFTPRLRRDFRDRGGIVNRKYATQKNGGFPSLGRAWLAVAWPVALGLRAGVARCKTGTVACYLPARSGRPGSSDVVEPGGNWRQQWSRGSFAPAERT